MSEEEKNIYKSLFEYPTKKIVELGIENEKLKEIADKYNVTVANICIKWCLQNGVIPIPKSKNKERMLENLKEDFIISEEDMKTLNNFPYIGGSGLDSETITLFN